MQRTPFTTAKEAVTEFCKIFRSKTGNIFQDITFETFVKKPKKYRLMKIERTQKKTHELLKPFVWEKCIQSTLSKDLQSK